MSRTLLARLSAAALLLAGCWIAFTQTQAPPKLSTSKVKDDLYMIEGDGGNVAVYVTNEGVILVDDKFDQDHDAIVAKVKSVTDQPVKYILSTHYHADHSGGNAKFLSTAEIISTANARANIVNTSPVERPAQHGGGARHVHRRDRGVSGRKGSPRALLRPRPHQRRRHHLFPRAPHHPHRRHDGGHHSPDRLPRRRQRGRVDQDARRRHEAGFRHRDSRSRRR